MYLCIINNQDMGYRDSCFVLGSNGTKGFISDVKSRV